MKKILNKISTLFMNKKTVDNQSALINMHDSVKVREKIKQAVQESNLDQQEILKEYKKKFSATK